jgi:peptide deformylase
VTIRPIRQVGDPVLRTRTDEVTVFDDALQQLVVDMFDTMYDAPGVGLAANQIGVGLRLFVYDCGPEEDADGEPGDGPVRKGVLCNPRITELGGRPATDPGEPDWTDGDEGCLSVRGLQFETPRWSSATAVGVDEYGQPVTIRGSGLLARALQHETDHLDGRLYLDRLVGDQKAAARRALSS